MINILKKGLFIFVLLIIPMSIFAEGRELTVVNFMGDLLTGDIKTMKDTDFVFYEYVISFVELIVRFFNFSRNIIMICCFLFIVFSSLKLFFGATELRKFVAEGIFKALFVVVALGIFPTVVSKTITIASQIGTKISGGQEKVETVFYETLSFIKNVWTKTTNTYLNDLKDAGLFDENGNYIISIQDFESDLVSSMGQDVAEAFAKENNITVVSDYEYRDYLSNQNFYSSNPDINPEERYKNLKERKGNGITNLSESETKKMMKEQLAILNSMVEFISGSDPIRVVEYTSKGRVEKVVDNYKEASITDVLSMGENQIKDLAQNLFIKSTNFLSLSSTIKVCLLMGDMISAKANAVYDTETDSYYRGEVPTDFTWKTLNPIGFTKWLGCLLIEFIYSAALTISLIFVMAEYYLSILNFLFVMALSSLLIPLYFIDATKQYAVGIIKTVISFFLKILATTTACFYVVSSYIRIQEVILTKSPSTSTTVYLYLFCIFFGFILIKKIDVLASSILSGNPALGIEDVTRQVHSAIHAGRSAYQAAKFGAHVVGDLGRWGVQKGLGTISTFRAAGAAYKSAADEIKSFNAMHDDGPRLSNGEIFKTGMGAALRTVGASAAQSLGDAAYKTVTGQEIRRDSNQNKTVKFGQTYTEDGLNPKKANFDDMVTLGKHVGSTRGQKAAKNVIGAYKDEALSLLREASMPPDDQDSILNK